MFAFWDFKRRIRCGGVNCISFLSSRMKYLCVSQAYFRKPWKIEGNKVSCFLSYLRESYFIKVKHNIMSGPRTSVILCNYHVIIL